MKTTSLSVGFADFDGEERQDMIQKLAGLDGLTTTELGLLLALLQARLEEVELLAASLGRPAAFARPRPDQIS